MTGDNYTTNTGDHNVGDIVVYYDASRNVVHSATISNVGSGCISGITGLGGTQSQVSSCGINEGFNNYSSYTVFSN